MKKWCVVLVLCLLAMPASAQKDRSTPRPIEALDTVWIEDMTWMEVRDAIKAGKTTVIVAAGSVEESGPYVTNAKHNQNLRVDAETIARRLGNALVAPMIGIGASQSGKLPEVDDTLYPGTFALRPEVLKMVLTDICGSLKQHGFKNIILIDDNTPNEPPMKEIASTLTAKWAGKPSVNHIPEYHVAQDLMDRALPGMGIHEKPEGIRDRYRVTALLMMVNPEYVRFKQRVAAGKTTINGVNIAPAEQTVANGKKLFEIKMAMTLEAIKKVVVQANASQ